MTAVYNNQADMAMALWARLSTQMNSFSTTVRLTALEFNSLWDVGEKWLLYHSMFVTRKETEFIADSSNPNVVFLGNPQELEHATGCSIAWFPGSRLRMLWRPLQDRVGRTNLTIPATTNATTMSVMNSGNLSGPVNFPNHGNIRGRYLTRCEDVARQVTYEGLNVLQSFEPIIPLRSQSVQDLTNVDPSESRKRKSPIDDAQQNDASYGNVDDQDSQPKPKRQKCHDPKPMNAFFLFRQDYTRHEKCKHQIDISGEVSRLWNAMSEEEKEPWREKARGLSEERKKRREPAESQSPQEDMTENLYETDPYLKSVIDNESAPQSSPVE
ncbi:hypothetical protein F4679DRAFT_589654 [Xylaria curta]|nr:hypothetical protein F4679DRAFT_589654 [Xylaria curta]